MLADFTMVFCTAEALDTVRLVGKTRPKSRTSLEVTVIFYREKNKQQLAKMLVGFLAKQDKIISSVLHNKGQALFHLSKQGIY